MGIWRNGRRGRLKIYYPFGCMGSSPIFPTRILKYGVVLELAYKQDLKSCALMRLRVQIPRTPPKYKNKETKNESTGDKF